MMEFTGIVKSCLIEQEEPDGNLYKVFLEGETSPRFSYQKFEAGQSIKFTSVKGKNELIELVPESVQVETKDVKVEKPSVLRAKTVFQRVVEVMKLVSPIAKVKKSSEVPYAFRGIDDLYNSLQPLFAAAGLFITPRVLDKTSELRIVKKPGSTYNGNTTPDKEQYVTSVSLNIEWSIYGEEGDCISGIVPGEATDYSDKAIAKAVTMSMKYFLMNVFLIPTADIMDGDNHQPEIPADAQPMNPGAPFFKWGKDEGLPWMTEAQFEKAMSGIENNEDHGASMLPSFLKVKMKKEFSGKIKEALVRHGVCKP